MQDHQIPALRAPSVLVQMYCECPQGYAQAALTGCTLAQGVATSKVGAMRQQVPLLPILGLEQAPVGKA